MRLAPRQPWLSRGNSLICEAVGGLLGEAYAVFLQNAIHFPNEMLRACRRLGREGWVWGQRCHAGAVLVPLPMLALCMGKCWGKSRLSAAFYFLPDMFTATWRGFSQGSGHSPIEAGGFWSPCPAWTLSTGTVALPWNAAGMSQAPAQHSAQMEPCLSTPARGSGRPRCHEMCTASASPHAAHQGQPVQGSSRQLLESGPSPNNGWRAGNAAWETGFGSAAAASHGPLAPFLSLLQRVLPTALSHGAAPRGRDAATLAD